MLDVQEKVLTFHRKYEVKEADYPHEPDWSTVQLRRRLCREEAKELDEALESGDLVKIADALGDEFYVLAGTAITYGIDLQPIIDEIHRSNMTKSLVLKDGFGKVLKGPEFSPPDLLPILTKQGMKAMTRDQIRKQICPDCDNPLTRIGRTTWWCLVCWYRERKGANTRK